MRFHGKLGAGRTTAAPQTAHRTRCVLRRNESLIENHRLKLHLPETAFRVETDLNHRKQSTALGSTRNSIHSRRVRAFFAFRSPARRSFGCGREAIAAAVLPAQLDGNFGAAGDALVRAARSPETDITRTFARR